MLSVDYKQAIKEMSEQEFNKFCEFAGYSKLKNVLERDKKDVGFGIQDTITHTLCDCCENGTAYESLCEKLYLAIRVVVGYDRVLSYIKK